LREYADMQRADCDPSALGCSPVVPFSEEMILFAKVTCADCDIIPLGRSPIGYLSEQSSSHCQGYTCSDRNSFLPLT